MGFFSNILLYCPRIDLYDHKVWFDENEMYINPLKKRIELL